MMLASIDWASVSAGFVAGATVIGTFLWRKWVSIPRKNKLAAYDSIMEDVVDGKLTFSEGMEAFRKLFA